MMSKKNIILIIVCITVILFAVWALLLNGGSNKTKTAEIETEKVLIPTKTSESYFSDTGAVYISPTDNEYNEIELIKILRSKVPIKNDYFSIDFDYQTNKFVVKIVNNSQENKVIWEKWVNDSGYGLITSQYWKVQ